MEPARCVGEYGTLLQIANFTLWVSVVAAIIILLLTVVERILAMRKKPVEGAGGGDGAGVATFLDSLKGLVAALAAAPPWFAIFLAGILLLWFAGRFTPVECRKQLEAVEHPAAPPDNAKAADKTAAPTSNKS